MTHHSSDVSDAVLANLVADRSPRAPSAMHWLSIIGMLTIREMHRRHRRLKGWGFFLLMIEPVLAVIAFVSIFTFLERKPAYGTSQFLFHGTGVLLFYLFMRLAIRGKSHLEDRSRRFPRVNEFDSVMASFLLEFTVMTIATVLFFIGVALFDTRLGIPWNPLLCVAIWLLVTVLGIGLGLANYVMSAVVPVWSLVLQVLGRGLMVLSGVFYVFAFMPTAPRSYLAWNPMIHAVEAFRATFYPHYPDFLVDIGYLVWVAAASFVGGIVIFRGFVISR